MRLLTSGDARFRVGDGLGLDVVVTREWPVRIRRAHLAVATMGLEIVDEESPDLVKGRAGGAGRVELSRVEGDGSVSLRPEGSCLRVFETTRPLTVLAPSAIIAVDTTIDIALGGRLDRSLSVARSARNAWDLQGRGLLALGTNGRPTLHRVTTDAPLLVEAGALVAYSSGLAMSEADDYRRRVHAKGLKAAVGKVSQGLGLPLKVDGGRDRIWVVAEGDGVVVVQDVVD